MAVAEIEIAPSRAMQRYYPWVIIGIAFLTVRVAFGALPMAWLGARDSR